MKDGALMETSHFSIEAEQQLLGALLCNNDRLDTVASIVGGGDFYDPVHQVIWGEIQRRVNNQHLASPVTLATTLGDMEGLKELGGAKYLARLAGASVSGFAIEEYARIILEYRIKRDMAAALDAAQGALPHEDLIEVKARLEMALAGMPEVVGRESTYSLLKAVTDAVGDAVKSHDGETTFLKTGLPALDKILRGLAPGDLMLLGGTTSMGKTATAIEIAKVCAFDGTPGGAVFWSLEMSHQELATRMISERASVPYASLRDAASLSDTDYRRWVEKSRDVASGAMRIVPKHIRDLAAGMAAMKRARADMGVPLRLAVVDYAQLIRAEGRGRYEQMTNVSIGLKHMAGLLGCPVVALVQLSRDIGFREDRRPQLSDIKETGQFENDADQVVFCNRESYWLQRMGPKLGKDGTVSTEARADWEADMAAAKNKMELIVRKNRHGRLATAEVGFHAPTNRFWDLSEKDPTEDFQ